MRIKPGDGEARMRDAEALTQIARDDAAGLDDEIGGEAARNVAQRQMDGDRNDGELGRPQHHHRACSGTPVISAASFARNSVWPGSAKPLR